MEGLLAVAGFWIFMIVVVVKWGDVKRAQAQSFNARGKEIEAMQKRLLSLEQEMSSITHQLIELQESHEFAVKLIGKDNAGMPPDRIRR